MGECIVDDGLGVEMTHIVDDGGFPLGRSICRDDSMNGVFL
jgi:hypothetical protein